MSCLGESNRLMSPNSARIVMAASWSIPRKAMRLRTTGASDHCSSARLRA
jgi:hypothetical protein